MILTGELNEVVKLKRSGKIILLIRKEDTVELENFCDMPLTIGFGETTIPDVEIDNVRERAGKGRVVFRFSRDDTVHFAGKTESEISLDVRIDAEEQLLRMSRISDDQRRKIFALCRDLATSIGESLENTREGLTLAFCHDTQREMFSLSDVAKETAGEFIEWIINFAFEQGMGLREHPRKYIDIERAIAICIKRRLCIVCGKPAEVHHVDSIGMGRDRRTVDDSRYRKLPLCREHHSEAHSLGVDSFAAKYHLGGGEGPERCSNF